MRRTKLWVLGVLLVGCNRSDLAVESHLQPLASCADVESAIRQSALATMNRTLDEQLKAALERLGRCRWTGPWDEDYAQGVAQGGPSAGPSAGLNGAPSAVDSARSDGSASSKGPDAYSETNNQVAGVDEADFVKTDGKHLYLVTERSLRIIQSWPPESVRELARVPLAGRGKKLFVAGDRLLVYSSLSTLPESRTSGKTRPNYGSNRECTYGYDCTFTGDGTPTQLTVFNIARRDRPVKVRELQLSGSLVAARRVGRAIHTVVSSPGPAFPSLSSSPQGINTCTETEVVIRQAFEELRAKNAEQIRTARLENWLPTMTDTTFSGSESTAGAKRSLVEGCPGFYRSELNDGSTFTSVISLDIASETAAQSATIVARPGAIYASGSALFMAVPRDRARSQRWYAELESASELSEVHKFLLKNEPPAALYAASGLVKGRVLNQFAMDEHEQHLRIATTTGHLPSPDVHNTVSVLRQRDGNLDVTGQVDRIAPGEDIRSVRFDEEKGYIVTFKKTDPLFVLDLANPSAPKVSGELKIPGFSTYMHRMDKNHLLTIGYDAADKGSFAWFTGVLLQIFDVADPGKPTLAHKEIIGTRGSSSEALTNHLAFTYFAPKNLLALPMTICEGGSTSGGYGTQMTFSGLMVYDVTTVAGFKLRGKVAHPTGSATCSNWWTHASSQVKRSIVMDDVVFSISGDTLKVSPLADLTTDVAELSLAE
ncbi:MAG: beta-propeller domain-containing protein [Deltaproteobacteria bacterium]|nr:beta-propeller domain-containing protein [Deltaproteobacteria bacterium]